MNTSIPDHSNTHANISVVRGADWWAQVFYPKKLFLRRVARKLKAYGRESFTLPDGSTWFVADLLPEEK